jgi:hypothetical protein
MMARANEAIPHPKNSATLRFWPILIVEITNVVDKPNQLDLDLLPVVGVSRLHQPSTKEVAYLGKGEPLWEELRYLHWISAS